MNIIDFTNSITYDDFDEDIHSLFDENLILYRLMNGVSGINISSAHNTNGALYHISVSDAKHTVQEITQYLKLSLMSMYSGQYNIDVSYDGNLITVIFGHKD
jgi:hypothetical protein